MKQTERIERAAGVNWLQARAERVIMYGRVAEIYKIRSEGDTTLSTTSVRLRIEWMEKGDRIPYRK